MAIMAGPRGDGSLTFIDGSSYGLGSRNKGVKTSRVNRLVARFRCMVKVRKFV